MKIVMVLTSHDKLGNTGKPTGFWLEEFAAPYRIVYLPIAVVALVGSRRASVDRYEPS